MAIYDNLPVYKASYDLLLEVHKMNINLTREYRYTIGEKLKTELMDLMVAIYKANSTDEHEKERCQRIANQHIVVVKLYMRLLHDLGQIKLVRFVALNEKAESISKQITAWHKSTVGKFSKKMQEEMKQ
ncbi:MAG: four helix bundle protein [Rikenellaceae bacterium]|nr:four helix bundle protein [Rikenellaceae bacterium]MCL2693435.1 four helix bundle protein [Rikenellaceae bacterium]